LILGRASVQTATEIDTGEDMYTESYRDSYRGGQVYSATEIDTGEDKCTDSYRERCKRGQLCRQLQRFDTGKYKCKQLQSLIQERTRVQTAKEIDTGEDN
jgi:hypothetical protein